MSFKLPDLIVESILRDGFKNARNDPTIIQDIFCDLTRPFASKKYGQKEINKIIKFCEDDEVSIVHSFNPTQITMPCISIQLADDKESEDRESFGNFRGMQIMPDGDDEDKLATRTRSAPFTPSAYDPTTGVVSVPDAVNLASIYANLVFVDVEGTSHIILGGIDNTAGEKKFLVAANSEVAITGDGYIRTPIDYDAYEKEGNIEKVHLILGIHTKEALTTKYLYTLVKYFMLSRRDDLIARGLELNTYSGSDFTRNFDYGADMIYSRFFNVSGIIENEWRADKVQLVDSIDIIVQVPKDVAGNEELNLTDMTIQVKE